MGVGGANPVSAFFHHKGQTARWKENFQTVDAAVKWFARLPHLEIEKIVTPTAVYYQEDCRKLVDLARHPIEIDIPEDPAMAAIHAEREQAFQEAKGQKQAMENSPLWGAF